MRRNNDSIQQHEQGITILIEITTPQVLCQLTEWALGKPPCYINHLGCVHKEMTNLLSKMLKMPLIVTTAPRIQTYGWLDGMQALFNRPERSGRMLSQNGV